MDSDTIAEFLIGSFGHVIALVPVLFEIWWSKDCTGECRVLCEVIAGGSFVRRVYLYADEWRIF